MPPTSGQHHAQPDAPSAIEARKPLLGLLRDARLAHELSQLGLAGRLGLHQREISDLERGAMDPRRSISK